MNMHLKKYISFSIPDLTGNPKHLLLLVLSELTGKSPILSFLAVIQWEAPWDMSQDLREVCDHAEGKVEICLVKKMWASIRIALLLGLVFMIILFMQKFSF